GRVNIAAEAGADDARAVVHSPPDPLGYAVLAAAAAAGQHLDGHDLSAPGHADHSPPVIAHGRRDARGVCAVAVVVIGVVVVGDDIPAGYDLVFEVGVVGGGARVQDGNDDVGGAGGDVACVLGVYR